ncbi:MAG: RNA methyltransferase [Ignavibacteriae bacterium]|nr:RNA methyltransferase [Ignavibacteriota bacterium]
MTEQRKEKIFSILKHRQPDLTVVVENIHDPHNVSAILRSADAVGVLEVYVVYSHEQIPKLGRKSSASAKKWVPCRPFKSISECYAQLRQAGFSIYASHLGKTSTPLYELDLTKKVALVFGNEHRGVSNEAAQLADANFWIPMVGMIQSLNVSVACAVTLYEAFRQRQLAGCYKKSPLPSREIRRLFSEWSQKR